MNRHSGTKINILLKKWPKGAVAVSSWLNEQVIYRQLIQTYQKSDWVNSIGGGAFVRSDDKIDWTGALFAIQSQLMLPVHAAGKTALQLEGFSHFLSLGKETDVFLFGAAGVKLPTWFKAYHWEHKIHYTATNLFPDVQEGLTKIEINNLSIEISSPERAIMEVLHLFPSRCSFEEGRLLFEGLTTLRPGLVQTLLEKCKSVKVKRMFLYLADECNHAWRKKLNLSKIDLGKGKRELVKGGNLNTQYNIVVPRKSEL
ncbi:MAG: hypothetical protein HGA76_08320 [Candidatus Firestonebacteria bacterium]|nr:hypothetical protein [Candidatus Firestonebacteria bacterium]